MYRLDNITLNATASYISNIGAVSQESVVSCQGVVYFFSGLDIRQTDGTYPQQISRLGVQDYIDAIPSANWSSVCSGTDGLNVYFSIGNITLHTNQNSQKTYNNVVLKFSPRDQTWSVHSYAQQPLFYANLYNASTQGIKMLSADATGSVQTANSGLTDNGSPIFYFVETQNQEFGNRSQIKSSANNVAIFCKNGSESSLQVATDDNDFKDYASPLPLRVNVITTGSFSGYYARFKWFGSTSTETPVFEGIQIEKVVDQMSQPTDIN